MKNAKKKAKFKIVEHYKVQETQYGEARKENYSLEPHEEDTIDCLVTYGFDVETIIPSNVPGSKNPDILMLGTLWEMKGPQTTNEKTIRALFRRAVKQAGGRVVFDLRKVKKDSADVEEYMIELFATTRGMRRIMIIREEKILDFLKQKR